MLTIVTSRRSISVLNWLWNLKFNLNNFKLLFFTISSLQGSSWIWSFSVFLPSFSLSFSAFIQLFNWRGYFGFIFFYHSSICSVSLNFAFQFSHLFQTFFKCFKMRFQLLYLYFVGAIDDTHFWPFLTSEIVYWFSSFLLQHSAFLYFLL